MVVKIGTGYMVQIVTRLVESSDGGPYLPRKPRDLPQFSLERRLGRRDSLASCNEGAERPTSARFRTSRYGKG